MINEDVIIGLAIMTIIVSCSPGLLLPAFIFYKQSLPLFNQASPVETGSLLQVRALHNVKSYGQNKTTAKPNKTRLKANNSMLSKNNKQESNITEFIEVFLNCLLKVSGAQNMKTFWNFSVWHLVETADIQYVFWYKVKIFNARMALEIKRYRISQHMDRDAWPPMLSTDSTVCWQSGSIWRKSTFDFTPTYSHNIGVSSWPSLWMASGNGCSHTTERIEGFTRPQVFLSAVSSMLLPLQVFLMAQVNHTTIREKMNYYNNCNDLLVRALQEKAAEHDSFSVPWLCGGHCLHVGWKPHYTGVCFHWALWLVIWLTMTWTLTTIPVSCQLSLIVLSHLSLSSIDCTY